MVCSTISFLKSVTIAVALFAAVASTPADAALRLLQKQQQQSPNKPTPAPTGMTTSTPTNVPTTTPTSTPTFSPIPVSPVNWYTAAEASDYNNAVHAAFFETIPRVRGTGEAYGVFDWDNTCMYGDISYTSVYYQMNTLAYRIPPSQFEQVFALGYTASSSDACLPRGTNTVLGTDVHGANVTLAQALADTAADYKVLYDTYIAPTYNLTTGATNGTTNTTAIPTLAQVKETVAFQNFRAKIAFLTFGLEASYGAKESLPCAVRIGMTVFPQLLVGMTDSEIRTLIRASVRWHLSAKLDALTFTATTGVVVKGEYSTGLRVFNGQETAMRTLRANGADVFIISASPQVFVEEVGSLLGLGFLVPRTNVFGVRFTFEGGRFTGQLVRDYPITWGPGKAAIVETLLKPKYRGRAPVYASGDSNGDCEMLETVRDGIVHVNNRLKDATNCIQTFYERACLYLKTREQGTNNWYLLQGQDKELGSWIPSGFSTKDGKTYKSSATTNNACAAYKFLQ